MNQRQRQAIKQYKVARAAYQVEVDMKVGHFTPDISRNLSAAEDTLIDAMIGEGASDRAKRLGGYVSAINLAKQYAKISQ